MKKIQIISIESFESNEIYLIIMSQLVDHTPTKYTTEASTFHRTDERFRCMFTELLNVCSFVYSFEMVQNPYH